MAAAAASNLFFLNQPVVERLWSFVKYLQYEKKNIREYLRCSKFTTFVRYCK